MEIFLLGGAIVFSNMQEVLQGMVDKFSSWMEGERKSPNTVRQYRFLVSSFLSSVNKKPSEITRDDIERFKSHIAVDRKYSKATQYLFMKAIAHFYRFCMINPPDNLTAPKRSAKLPVYLSEREAGILLGSCADITRKSILHMLASTGIRVSELCSLDVQDVDLVDGIVKIRAGKGDKDRIVLMTEGCRHVLVEYASLRAGIATPSTAFFLSSRKNRFDSSTIERIVRQEAVKAGIQKKVTPHVLRHTFATALLRNGGDIRFIQRLLGHSSISTTEIYTHVDDGALRSMYEKSQPRYEK